MEFERRTALDIFSGCGGMTLGLKRAGFTVLGAVDNNNLAAKTYKLNHPEVKLWSRDIRWLPTRTVLDALLLAPGELDLLAACPPCQGFSSMTTLNGAYQVEDPRNDLILNLVRFIRRLQPKAVMLENVPGLREDNRFSKFLRTLRNLGYECSVDILDAAKYGVPQRRRRLILLAGNGFTIPFARQARNTRTVRDTIGSLPRVGRSGDRLHDFPEKRTPRIRNLIASIPRNGGNRQALPDRLVLDCHRSFHGFKDVYGRMRWDDVAPTITSGCVNPSKGRFLHPSANRCISLREAALLQSFPKRYKFALDQGKFAVADVIGNALPPEFVRRHAREVLHAISREQE